MIFLVEKECVEIIQFFNLLHQSLVNKFQCTIKVTIQLNTFEKLHNQHIKYFTVVISIMSIKTFKSIGPGTEPCGTPEIWLKSFNLNHWCGTFFLYTGVRRDNV